MHGKGNVFTVISLVYLKLLLGLSSGSSEASYAENFRFPSDESKSCFYLSNECRFNSTCHTSYKNVKKNCSFYKNNCQATQQNLRGCALDINNLQASAFKETCDCAGKRFNLKKFDRCSRIHNMVFANPCYDKAVTLIEEERKILAVTLRAAVATEADVTQQYSIGSSSIDTQPELSPTVTPDPDVSNEIPLKRQHEVKPVKLENTIRSHHSQPKVQFTEDELREIDDFLAIDNENRIHPIELRRLHQDDDSNSNYDTETGNELDANKVYKGDPLVDERKEDNIIDNSKTIDGLAHDPFDDVFSETLVKQENDRNHIDVTDANDNEIARVVAQFMGDNLELKDDGHPYETVEELEIQVSEQERNFRMSELQDNQSKHKNPLNIVLIMSGTVIFLLCFLGGVIIYRRVSYNGYFSGRFRKRPCQSAIIIQPVYDDNNKTVVKFHKTTHNV